MIQERILETILERILERIQEKILLFLVLEPVMHCRRLGTAATAVAPAIRHLPVFASEVCSMLQPKDGQIFLDMTFGGGGHTRHLLSLKKDIHVIALDRDPEAHIRAIELSKKTENRVIPVLGRFSEAPQHLEALGVKKGTLNGIIMDLGASSYQMETSDRGFGLARDGPLDMRMDKDRFPNQPTAADVINTLDSDALANIFKAYGDERHAKKIAQAIVDSRFMMHSIKRTKQLTQLVSSIVDTEDRFDAIGRETSAATKVFQALRIFVNNELNELDYAIEKMREYLYLDPRSTELGLKDKSVLGNDPRSTELGLKDKSVLENESVVGNEPLSSGVMAIISFHSLEDSIVKNHFNTLLFGEGTNPYKQRPWNAMEVATDQEIDLVSRRKWLPLKKFVLFPTEVEILTNPKSRSAKLRCAMRVL